MRNALSPQKSWLGMVAAGVFCAGTGQAVAAYVQTDLVSNIAGLATITDPMFWSAMIRSASRTVVCGDTDVMRAPL